MKNLHAFVVTYLGPTDRTGAKVKITSQRFGSSKILPRDCSVDPQAQAIHYLREIGVLVIGSAEMKGDRSLLLSENFIDL